MFVDGFHAPTNTVFEFLGCNFHGCKLCHPLCRNQPLYSHPDRTIEEVYESTRNKLAALRASGFTVVEKWECQYVKERKTNPQLKAFAESNQLVTLLEPRDAFFGGRTGAISLYAKAAPGEQI